MHYVTAMYVHCRLTSTGCMVLMWQHKLLCSFTFSPLGKMAILTPRNFLVDQGITLTYFVNIYIRISIFSAKMPSGRQAEDPTLGSRIKFISCKNQQAEHMPNRQKGEKPMLQTDS